MFRGIQKQEWTNLFNFIQAKRINIENLEEANQGPGGNANLDFSGFDLGEDIDTGVFDFATGNTRIQILSAEPLDFLEDLLLGFDSKAWRTALLLHWALEKARKSISGFHFEIPFFLGHGGHKLEL